MTSQSQNVKPLKPKQADTELLDKKQYLERKKLGYSLIIQLEGSAEWEAVQKELFEGVQIAEQKAMAVVANSNIVTSLDQAVGNQTELCILNKERHMLNYFFNFVEHAKKNLAGVEQEIEALEAPVTTEDLI